MLLSLVSILHAAITLGPQAFEFQSESVAYQDMSRRALALDFMQLSSLSDLNAQHVVVRFESPLSNSARGTLSGFGLQIQKSLGWSAYTACIDSTMLNPRGVMQAADMKEWRYLEPRWKLHSFLADGRIPRWTSLQPLEPDPVVAIYTMLHEDVDIKETALAFEQTYGAFIRSTVVTNNTIVMELSYSTIDQLIEEDSVLYVEPALPNFKEMNDSNRTLVQADAAQEPPYGLDGQGVVVMVYDGGYGYSNHVDFGGRHTVRDSSGLSDHATHVAGTIGGDGSASGGQYRGMAPAVTIESYGFEQEGGLSEGFLYSDPGDLEQDYGDAINNFKAVIANNSIGTNTASNGFPCEWTGDYGITSNLIDSVVRGDLGGDIRIVWANGNERQTSNCGSNFNTTAPPACAKNHITVGAINSNDESMTGFSSWGPTDDGRIKPDISAPGCQSDGDGGVTSCSSSGGYSSKCGTSMACPTVAGLSALIVQDWRMQFPKEEDLRNSTLKALFAHTAEDKFNIGPDCQYGYGSVRVTDAINHMRAENFAELEIFHGETLEMLVFVENPSEVKVTIAWDDVPATPLVIPSLVNDLDLVVIDPNGVTHYPWTIDPSNPSEPAVRTKPDHLNNIEQVQIDAAGAGVYRIQITGYSIAEGPQTFALMASPMLIQCSSSGLATFDRSLYACGAEVTLQIVDCDLNTDDGAIEFVSALVQSSAGDQVEVVLSETGDATSAFVTTLQLGVDLLADEGDTITMTYIDSNDGQGGSDVKVTDVATVDCSSPIIETVLVSEVLTREATIHVTTNEDTTVSVSFGTSCSDLDDVAVSGSLSSSHDVRLTGLEDNTTYFASVTVYDGAGNATSDDNNGFCYTFTTEDIPSFFTEQDSGFDLDGMSVTFTPYTNVDQYRACTEPITQLPSDPNGGSTVSLSDDDYESRNTSQPVWLYGESYSQLYICSNGRITFGSGSTDYTESISEHFEQAGISMLWDDLNPANGGTIRFAEYSDRSVVTFNGVPEYSNNGSNTFQCELFYDSKIRLSWLGVDSDDNIVGLSAGGGQPQDFEESDLSESNDCVDPTIPGDVNGDGFANITDILAIIDGWGPCDGCPADLNGDGLVNITDILEVIEYWSD